MNGSATAESEVTSLRPFRICLAFGYANAATWMVALGTPLVLLAGQLGASPVEVGLIYSFVFLLLPIQVLATVGLPRFGYKRQMFVAWSSRALFLLIPLWLTLLAPVSPERWMVWALVGSVFGFCFMRALGSCAFMPWLYHLVPDELRGRYFATDQFLSGISGLLTLLFCAALFTWLTPYEAFFWQYTYAIAGAVLAAFFLLRFPPAPAPARTSLGHILRMAPALCFRSGSFRQYLGFMVTSALLMTAFPPFAAYYLKVEAGMPMERIMLLSAVLFTGLIGGAWVLRPRLDRIGVKPVWRIALLLKMLVFLFWMGMVWGVPGVAVYLPVAYFVFGISLCFWNSAHLKYLVRVCPEDDQPLAISTHTAVVGFLGGVAPIVWGWVFRETDAMAGLNQTRFLGYLGLAVVGQIVLFAWVRRLTSKHRERPGIQMGMPILRPFRYLAHLIHIPTDVTKAVSHKKEGDESAKRTD